MEPFPQLPPASTGCVHASGSGLWRGGGDLIRRPTGETALSSRARSPLSLSLSPPAIFTRCLDVLVLFVRFSIWSRRLPAFLGANGAWITGSFAWFWFLRVICCAQYFDGRSSKPFFFVGSGFYFDHKSLVCFSCSSRPRLINSPVFFLRSFYYGQMLLEPIVSHGILY